MAKILLVEDDENLREIYQARLVAEGYEIVSAKDGEEALVAAKQEKPDLIIADIMMPRISGFEMLDILRNTEGMKHVRVIMLTALGQAEDKQRADKLGADRYLVKSQVTLEDIVHAASEILGDQAVKPEAAAPTPVQTPAPNQPSMPAVTVTTPVAPPQPTTAPVQQAPAPTPTTPTPTAPVSATTATPNPAPQPMTPRARQSTPMSQISSPTPSAPAVPTAIPVSNPAPSAPPVAQPVPPRQPSAPVQSSSSQNPVGSHKEINNATQLADAVNNLINGTSSQVTSVPQHGSVPTASSNNGQQIHPTQATSPSNTSQPQQPPMPRPTTGQPPVIPRAFPTGAPTVAPEPPKPAGPPVRPPEPTKPYPGPNVTQPQTPTPPEPQIPPNNNPDSIAIKDKKTVSPLMSGGGTANSDLSDLLKKENDNQDPMIQLNSQHQPGQVFTPGGSNSTDDPGKISL